MSDDGDMNGIGNLREELGITTMDDSMPACVASWNNPVLPPVIGEVTLIA